MKAVRVLDSSAGTGTFHYTFTLYIPIFTQAAIDISLAESGKKIILEKIEEKRRVEWEAN
jgi:hypothetical protein